MDPKNKNIYRDSFFFAITLFSKTPPNIPHPKTRLENDSINTTNTKWTTLSKFLLYYILKFLPIRTEIHLLRSVCKSWRKNLPVSQIPIIPLGFNCPPVPDSILPILLHHSSFFLLSATGESLRPRPWLVRVNDVTHELDKGRFQLRSVVDGKEFFKPDPGLSGRVELFRDCNAVKLMSSYALSAELNGGLICLSEKAVGNWDFGSKYLFTVLANVQPYGLVYLKMGHEVWVRVKEMGFDGEFNYLSEFKTGDIVFYDEEFYVFDVSSWKIGVIDPNDEDLIEFIDGPSGVVYQSINGVDFVNVDGDVFGMKGVWFVPAKDGLYLVFEVNGFEYEVGVKEGLIVFKLDENEWEWERVESIGEQVFFIGRDVAFSVLSEKLPLWKSGDVCLFTRTGVGRYVDVEKGELPRGLEMLDGMKYEKYWKVFRVYNMEEDEKGIVGFEELSKEVYTGLFFPPPKWVKWSCPSLGNVEVSLENLKLCDDDGDGVGVASDGVNQMVLEELE